MKNDALYLDDILQSIDTIGAHIQGVTEDTFSTKVTVYDAVIRRLALVCEAVCRLSATCKDEHPEIPWRDIKDMRNYLIHEYEGVKLDKVWEVVTKQLPDLRRVVE